MKKFSWERLIFALTFLFSLILIAMVTFMSYQVARLSDSVINNQPVPPIPVKEEVVEPIEEIVATPSAEIEEVEVEATPAAKPVVEEAE